MKRIILLILLSSRVLPGFGQDSHPVSWKFNSELVAPLTYKIKFEATVQEPYHIYPQGSGGMGMPTEFLFTADDNIEFVGMIEEKGIDTIDGGEVPYYKKGVTFTQTLKLKSEKKTCLSGTIKYMACNDQMCLPPSKSEFTLAINSQSKGAEAVNGNASNSSDKATADIKYEDFTMADANGKMVASEDITAKNKYTLIDFWASWCVPCRAQGRELISIYKTFNDKGFNVIAVSLDTKPAPWKRAIQDDGYTWTNVSDLKGFESEIVKKYRITAIPQNFLIGEKGKIIAMNLHGKELEAKLAELFRITQSRSTE